MIGRDDPWFVHLTHTYAALIRAGLPFAEASYGDGEWQCILGRPGENCDGTKYEPELGEALRHTLLEPVGQWCSFFDVPSPIRDAAIEWIEQHHPAVHWVAQRPYGRAATIGELAPFLQAVRTRRVVVVGPEHLAALPEEVVGPFVHVQVPMATAWLEVDRIADDVRCAVGMGDLVLFAAGMASNLLIHRLWRGLSTMLDVGALLDPYVGVASRRYHSDPEWLLDMKPRNLA